MTGQCSNPLPHDPHPGCDGRTHPAPGGNVISIGHGLVGPGVPPPEEEAHDVELRAVADEIHVTCSCGWDYPAGPALKPSEAWRIEVQHKVSISLYLASRKLNPS